MQRTGTVVRFDPAKGFGFVRFDDGKEAFLHKSALDKGQHPASGDSVTVILESAPKGLRVTKVQNIVAPERECVEATVKWYDARKGFGFITAPDGVEAFISHATLREFSDRAEMQPIALDEGDEVTVEIQASPEREGKYKVTFLQEARPKSGEFRHVEDRGPPPRRNDRGGDRDRGGGGYRGGRGGGGRDRDRDRGDRDRRY